MALGNKRTPRKLIKGRTGTGIINETRLTTVSSSLASEIFTDDPAIVEGPIAPVLYHTDLIQEDIDELRRHITEDRTITDNNYTTAEKSKLAGIEAGATGDQSASEIKTAYESNSNTNAFTDTEKSKLAGIEAGADVTDTTNVVNALTAGTNITIAANGTISSTATGGGGGLTETPLIAMSGRAQWSSTDSGELVHIGGSYGPVSFYSHTGEPNNATLRAFDSRQTIDTTSIRSAFAAYNFASYGIYVPNESKKVKLRATWRLQNAPASSTWGWSIWSADQPTTATGNSDAVLRARSSDVTYGNSSIATYFTTTTTTSAMNDTYIFPVLENRTGTLTTNTYAYFMLQLFLV